MIRLLSIECLQWFQLITTVPVDELNIDYENQTIVNGMQLMEFSKCYAFNYIENPPEKVDWKRVQIKDKNRTFSHTKQIIIHHNVITNEFVCCYPV